MHGDNAADCTGTRRCQIVVESRHPPAATMRRHDDYSLKMFIRFWLLKLLTYVDMTTRIYLSDVYTDGGSYHPVRDLTVTDWSPEH